MPVRWLATCWGHGRSTGRPWLIDTKPAGTDGTPKQNPRESKGRGFQKGVLWRRWINTWCILMNAPAVCGYIAWPVSSPCCNVLPSHCIFSCGSFYEDFAENQRAFNGKAGQGNSRTFVARGPTWGLLFSPNTHTTTPSRTVIDP